MWNKTYKLTAAAILCAVCMSGCGKTSEEELALASFSASIEDFTNYMKEADQKIDSLDVNKKESVDELLSILDGMNEETAKLKTIAVPAQYAGIRNPVETAADSMSDAVSYYHAAFESDTFSESDADVAYQYYQTSMKCIKIIGYVIAGHEVPQDENVTVYEGNNDSNLLDKWFDKNDDSENETETASETVPEAAE